MFSRKKRIRQPDVVYDNVLRDSIPKRGYYSELVAEMSKEDPSKDVCAKKRMKLILQVSLAYPLGTTHQPIFVMVRPLQQSDSQPLS